MQNILVNPNYNTLLREIKRQFDRIPKFDSKLGILNVFHSLEVDLPMHVMSDLGITDRISCEKILTTMRQRSVIKNFEFKSHREQLFCIFLEENFDETADVLSLKTRDVYISDSKGIYLSSVDGSPIYCIQGKRKKLVSMLLTEKCSAKVLRQSLGKRTDSEISNEIKEINKQFKKQLGGSDDLIINLRDWNGYRLNNDKFDIYHIG